MTELGRKGIAEHEKISAEEDWTTDLIAFCRDCSEDVVAKDRRA